MTTKPLQPEADHASGYFDVTGFASSALASESALAAVFDHTLLKPEATRDQVVKLCEEAASFRFACAMVNPAWVSLAHSVLAGSVFRWEWWLAFPWAPTWPPANGRRPWP